MPGPAPSFFCPRCGSRGDQSGPCERDGSALAAISEKSLLGCDVGNYVLVQLLGEGGMGSVYRGVHPAIGAEVAIKVLHATSEAAAQRFLVEAQAVNRVRHANLIKILDTGYLADRRPYLVMELLDGLSLAAAVGKLAPELACFIAVEALDALAAVHAEGIVHRDLKPPTVFITRAGRVVVLDFGIAKLIDGDAATQSTDLIGTPEYMAPEQIRSQPLDRRTDVYAMGVLLYETISGRRPFASAVTFDMLVQHLERPPTPPRDFMPTLAPAIDAAIMRALEKEPAQRFRDAPEMAAALLAAGGSSMRREDVVAFVAAHAPAPRPVPLEPQRQAVTTQYRGNVAAEPATKREGPAARGTAATKRERAGKETQPESQPRLAPDDKARIAPIDDKPGSAPLDDKVRVAPLDDKPGVAPLDDKPRARSFTPRHWLAIGALAIVAPAAIIGTMLAMRDPSEQVIATPSVQTHDGGVTTGILEIGSDPGGATVALDHAVRGVTPLTLAVPAGAHLIHVEYTGRGSVDQAVEVRAGERTSAMLVLPVPTASPVPTLTTAKQDRTKKTLGVKPTLTKPEAAGSGSATTPDARATDRNKSVTPERKDNPFARQPAGAP